VRLLLPGTSISIVVVSTSLPLGNRQLHYCTCSPSVCRIRRV